jgi:alpha-tubulin suppressor-like RCC1 family protein
MPNQFLSPEGDLENYFVTEPWLIEQFVGDELWVWGRNHNGQLGITNASLAFEGIPRTTFAGGTNWKQVSSGESSAAIKTDGTLWTWGLNGSGQLGDTTTSNRSTPVTTFAGGTNWKQVSCRLLTAAIKTDGTLWTWGSNFTGGVGSGQLGTNDTINRLTPVTTFAGGTNWKQVSCGNVNTSAIKTDGTLWVWGLNTNGQIGRATYGDSASTPVTTFAGGTNWKQVSSGYRFTMAIKTNGTLWVWGRSGQIGIGVAGDRLTPVTTFAGGTNWKQVSCGNFHTSAIKTDGTLWTWGFNNYGQLGNGVVGNRVTPLTTFAGGTNWKQVSSCYNSTLAVLSGITPDIPLS